MNRKFLEFRFIYLNFTSTLPPLYPACAYLQCTSVFAPSLRPPLPWGSHYAPCTGISAFLAPSFFLLALLSITFPLSSNVLDGGNDGGGGGDVDDDEAAAADLVLVVVGVVARAAAALGLEETAALGLGETAALGFFAAALGFVPSLRFRFFSRFSSRVTYPSCCGASAGWMRERTFAPPGKREVCER